MSPPQLCHVHRRLRSALETRVKERGRWLADHVFSESTPRAIRADLLRELHEKPVS